MLDSIQSYLPELSFIIPELILASGLLVLLISDLLISVKYRHILFGLAILIVISSLLVLLSKPVAVDPVLFKALFPNQASVFFRVLADLTMFLVLIFWFFSKKGKDNEVNTEYPFLYLAVLFATHILCISNSWISVFLSIEFISVASYILVGIAHEKRSTEAAFKYLIFGAMSTGIMLFGISLILASSGNIYFSGFEFVYADAFTAPDLLSIGLVMAFAGIFFKLSIFPFHFWVPDVYQGSSLPLMAMISTLPKIAAFGFFVSQFLFIWPQQVFMSGNLSVVLATMGILSLTWGNLAALQQKNFYRLMAYSGIAQVGFMMLALVNGYRDAFNLEIFLWLYVFMNMAVFISAESIKKESFNIGIDDFSGLGKSALITSLVIMTSMVALIGLPPTGGFTAKFIIFTGLFDWYSSSGEIFRLVVFIAAIVNVVISLFYYLRIPFFMYFREGTEETGTAHPVLKILAIFASAILILSFFLFGKYKEILIGLGADIV